MDKSELGYPGSHRARPRPVRQMIRVGYDHNALLAQEVSRLLEVPL